MGFTLNLSDEDFNRTLEEIDQLLGSQDTNIGGREIRGWKLFCQRQQLEGISMFDPISEKVIDWFKARYGPRLNVDLDFGHSVLLLRGDIIRFRCPRFWGRSFKFCCPELAEQQFDEHATNRPVLVNVVNQLDGVTAAYGRSLTPNERSNILGTITKSHIQLARIADAGTQTFVPEARADIRSSVEQMMLNERQFGPSKWASLQALEKFLKAYISQQSTVPARGHKLAELSKAAESLGLRTLNRSDLSLVQCSPSVRYAASSVTKVEAIKAHHMAVSLCADIATQLSGQSGWNTGTLARAFLSFNGKAEKVPGILIARTKEGVAFDPQIEAGL
jgi:hypothetical protein